MAVALRDTGGSFGALAQAIDEALAAEGFARESRAFRPHLTLARIRAPRGWREFRPAVEGLRTRSFGTGEVNAITLFSSTLGDGPARYSALATASLGAAVTSEEPHVQMGAAAKDGRARQGI
jgi:2'-5' RNA ligase